MPEIDRDLFQSLSLLLLLLAVIVLLALLATMSRANKLLREQLDRLKELSAGGFAPATSTGDDLESSLLAPAALDEPAVDEPALGDQPLEEAVPGEPVAHAGPSDETAGAREEVALTPEEPAPAADPTGLSAADEWASTPSEPVVTGDESGADAFAGLTEAPGAGATAAPENQDQTSSPFASEQAVDPFTGETAAGQTATDDPFTSQSVGAGEVDEDPFGASSAATSTSQEQDDEQPFEQGGRWYFRRDGELLVYDETTGEWVDASNEPGSQPPSETTSAWDEGGSGLVGAEETSSFATTGAVDTSREPDATETFDTVDEAAEPDEPASGGFWKCPSCGAVNGSTASTCRMCFAARP